jgi:putative zinc finger/helix-turn-helix YgiT family protein
MDKIFCPSCLKMVDFDVIERPQTIVVRGDEITVNARIPACRECGELIGTAVFGDETYRAAYNLYRARHGLLMPEQIREIRGSYGLGQKAFARLLGWGDVTLSRYENGSLQSDSHDAALRLAQDPENVRRLLQRHGARLSTDQRAEVESRLGAMRRRDGSIVAREVLSPYTSLATARTAEERAADAEVFQDFVIELRLERDGSYVAAVAEMPGCTATGDDPNEAVSLLRESVGLWLGASR